MIVSSIKSMSWWMEKKRLQVASSNGTCLIESVNTKNIEKKTSKIHKQTISKCDSGTGLVVVVVVVEVVEVVVIVVVEVIVEKEIVAKEEVEVEAKI